MLQSVLISLVLLIVISGIYLLCNIIYEKGVEDGREQVIKEDIIRLKNHPAFKPDERIKNETVYN